MALEVAQGTISAPASAGQVTETVGFEVKALLLWANDNTAFDTFTTIQRAGFGWTIGTAVGDEATVHHGANDGSALSGGKCSADNDACITLSDEGATVTLEANLFETFATTSTGFKLDFTTTISGVDIHYLAIGGGDITNVDAGDIDGGAATGNISTTSPGFQPDLVLFAGNGKATSFPNTGGKGWNVGAAISSTERWCVGTSNKVDTGKSGKATQHQLVTRCYFTEKQNSLDNEFDFVSQDASGFTIDCVVAGGVDSKILYLAIKGGDDFEAALGVETQATSATTKANTAPGFQPEGIFLVGCNATSTTGVISNCQLSFGGSDGTNESSIFGGTVDGNPSDISESDDYQTASKVFVHVTPGSPTVVDAEADLSSFDATGFTLDWTTADATAREFCWLVMRGAAAGATVSPGKATLTLTGKAPSTGEDPVTVAPGKGDLTLASKTPVALLNHLAEPAKATLTLTGIAGVASLGKVLTPAKAALVLTAAAPTTVYSPVVTPAKADLTLTGKAPVIEETIGFLDKASLVITGLAPAAVVAAAGVTKSPAKADLILTGKQPTGFLEIKPVVGTTTLTLTAKAPTATLGALTASPARAGLTLTGKAPTAFLAHIAEPGFADLQLIGFAPTTIQPVTVSPANADLTLTGIVGAAVQGKVKVPAKADLTITAKTPAVPLFTPAKADQTLTTKTPASFLEIKAVVGTAALTLTGKTPISSTGEIIVSPAKADLALTAKTPTAFLAHIAGPGLADLQLVGFAPTTIQPVTVSPAQADLTLTGITGVAVQGKIKSPAAAILSLASAAPIQTVQHNLDPAKADLTITGKAPVASVGRILTPATATLSLTSAAPVQTVQHNVAPARASLTLTGFAPLIAKIQSPAKAALTLAANAPVGLVNHIKSPARATLALAGKLRVITSQRIDSPAKAALTLTAKTPTAIRSEADVTPGPAVGAVTLTGKAPSFVITSIWTIQPEEVDIWVIQGEDSGVWTIQTEDDDAWSIAA